MSMHICYPLLDTPRTFASISRMQWRIVFGRICAELHVFVKMRELFVNVFLARRGYDKKKVKTASHRISNIPYADLIKTREPEKQPEAGTPFIYPYENGRDIHEHLANASHFAVAQLQHEPLAVSHRKLSARFRLMSSALL